MAHRPKTTFAHHRRSYYEHRLNRGYGALHTLQSIPPYGSNTRSCVLCSSSTSPVVLFPNTVRYCWNSGIHLLSTVNVHVTTLGSTNRNTTARLSSRRDSLNKRVTVSSAISLMMEQLVPDRASGVNCDESLLSCTRSLR